MENASTAQLAADLVGRLRDHSARLAVVGMGYVGLPLAIAAHKAGFNVVGFDIDQRKVDSINAGVSPIRSIPGSRVAEMRNSGRFHTTTDFDELRGTHAVMICVPTPLSRHRDPDLSYIEKTGASIARRLCRGQLIALESSTYPGTTREILQPILNSSGLAAGTDYFLGYAPEREDPGNSDFETASIPRVIGADDAHSSEAMAALYSEVIGTVIPVSSCATAEAVKLTENIFRAVNIALINELKVIYRKMGVDVWEVVDAAKSKPFGYMPFYPGPGIGGHCIPIDPFYLTWKAREFDVPTRFIELAGEINAEAPRLVVASLAEALSAKRRLSLNGARILLMGVAYKKDVDDMRESPSLRIWEGLEAYGAKVDYFDPFIPTIPPTREHATLTGRDSIVWERTVVESYDAALICTDHSGVDYGELVDWSKLVVDTRNSTRPIKSGREKIVLA